MVRSFWSELPKLRRWSVLGGGSLMILFTVYVPFFIVNQVASGVVGPGTMIPANLPPLLRTAQGIPAVLGLEGPAPALVAIVLIFVSVSIASEWSQGTVRNLLVAEPARALLLTGKMLALIVYMLVVQAIAIGLGSAVAIWTARSHGISTAAWTSSQGINDWMTFFGHSLLTIAGLSLLAAFIAVVVAVLTRSAAAAVGVSLGYALAVEALLNALWPNVAKWLPMSVFQDLASATPRIDYGTATAVGLLWMLLFFVGSLVAFRRSDVLA